MDPKELHRIDGLHYLQLLYGDPVLVNGSDLAFRNQRGTVPLSGINRILRSAFGKGILDIHRSKRYYYRR